MAYGEAKVYFDGSHYIAIPHTTRPAKPRIEAVEEIITVIDQDDTNEASEQGSTDAENGHGDAKEAAKKTQNPRKRKITRKALFEELYVKYQHEKQNERRRLISQAMRPYFRSTDETERYVNANLERKQRNLICRRIRMCRKANMQEFNYFVTFTYDSKLHTEQSFRKRLRNCLSHLCSRKGWRYIGVWERSPKKDRLHFHGIFYIPDGTMPGELVERNDYSFNTHKRQKVWQNTYFLSRFGRCDFEPFDDIHRKGDAMAYIMKYIDKSGEKIVYSRGLPQYFISDILEDDVVCPIGMEDQKLLLYDDFLCFDQGVLVGPVSRETISQLRKAN